MHTGLSRLLVCASLVGFGGLHLSGVVQVGGPPGALRWRALQARWVSVRGRRGGRDLSWPLTGDDVVVAPRAVADGQFEHPVEDEPAALRAAAVDAEHELVQVALQMRLVDRALMGAEEPPLGQRGDPVHGGQQLAGTVAAGPGGPLAAALVDVAEPGKPVVTHPGVGDHPRTVLDVPGDEGVQQGGGAIAQDRHPGPAVSPRFLDLDSDADQGLLALGPPAAQPWFLPADVGLVYLDDPGEPVPPRAHQHRAQPVQHRPGGLLRADLKRPCRLRAEIPSLAWRTTSRP